MRWGLLSAAAIGSVVVRATAASRDTRFVAVAARDGARAARFATEHGLERSYGSYEELLGADDIDAVYVALPAALHAEWTQKAVRAGKHVLCEKPFVTTAEEAFACADAARESGRRVVEGFMWRLHPQTRRVEQLVREGAIGRLSTVRAALTVSVPEDDIRFDLSLGGGALHDLGCYCVSAVRLFGGPVASVHATAVLEPDGLDRRLVAAVRCESGVLGLFDIGLDLAARRDELELVGTRGVLRITDPWICRNSTITLRTAESPADEVVPTGDAAGEDDVYRIEFDTVSRAFESGERLPFEIEDAVDQASVLEAILRSARSSTEVKVRP